MRKIEGDVDKLREEIREALGLKSENVVINRLTGHIIVKVCFLGAGTEKEMFC